MAPIWTMTSAPDKYFQPETLSRIAHLELRAQHVVEGFLSGMHKSPYKGLSVEFASHRSYAPGDDIRRIDWRVYAKADRYFIKEYEEETNMRVHLLLDSSRSMAYPEDVPSPHGKGGQGGLEGRMNKWDYAATVAVSLAYLLVSQQDAVGLTLFDRDLRLQIPPTTSRAGLSELTAAIEGNPPDSATDLKTLFHQIAAKVPKRGMVVVLSDLLADVNDLVTGLQRLRFDGHDVLVLQILDYDELEFPFADRTLFEGMEQVDLKVLSDPQSLRTSYLAALKVFLTKIRGACLDAKIDYVLMSTADPLDVALSTFLATRRHRQRARA